MKVRFRLNGAERDEDAQGLEVLGSALAEGKELPCGEGVCGACAVLVDGAITASCLVPVVQLNGAEVWTLDGLVKSGLSSELSVWAKRLSEALDHEALFPCGLCREGVLLAAAYSLTTDTAVEGAYAHCSCSDLASFYALVRNWREQGLSP